MGYAAFCVWEGLNNYNRPRMGPDLRVRRRAGHPDRVPHRHRQREHPGDEQPRRCAVQLHAPDERCGRRDHAARRPAACSTATRTPTSSSPSTRPVGCGAWPSGWTRCTRATPRRSARSSAGCRARSCATRCTARCRTTPVRSPRDAAVGIEALLFATDYPHSEGTFPFSKDVVDRMMVEHPDCTLDEFVAVLGGNAAKLFRRAELQPAVDARTARAPTSLIRRSACEDRRDERPDRPARRRRDAPHAQPARPPQRAHARARRRGARGARRGRRRSRLPRRDHHGSGQGVLRRARPQRVRGDPRHRAPRRPATDARRAAAHRRGRAPHPRRAPTGDRRHQRRRGGRRVRLGVRVRHPLLLHRARSSARRSCGSASPAATWASAGRCRASSACRVRGS